MKCVQIHVAECKICFFVCVRCVLMKNLNFHAPVFVFLFSFFGKVCVVPFLHPMELDDCNKISKVQKQFFCQKGFLQVLSSWWWCCLEMMSQFTVPFFFDTLIPHISTWCFPPAPHHRRVMEDMLNLTRYMDWFRQRFTIVLSHYLYCGSGQCLVGLLQGRVFSQKKSSTGSKTSRVHSMGKMVGTLAGCLGRGL